VTQNIQIEERTLYNTDYKLRVIDTPGLWSGDMDLKKWKKYMSQIPNRTFDYLTWVISAKQRKFILDDVTREILQYMFNNYQQSKLILVFTHCDLLDKSDKKDKLKSIIGNWRSSLYASSDSIKSRIIPDHCITFGLREGPLYPKADYVQQLINLLNKLQPQKISFNTEFDPFEATEKCMNMFSPEMQAKFKKEMENIKKQADQQVAEIKRQLEESL